MKKFLLPFLLILTTYITFAQAPQGTNYQAVAYNNLGQPVANQSVGVRLSVLDGGANGAVLYQETQQPSTDNTGLFSIVLGNGTPVTSTFAAINWGIGTKWLKSEIDIAGGNNYVVMGSSQFMSVPYALYANEAGFAKKAGPATAAFHLPDGFENLTQVIIPADSSYTVPAGKNLYLSNCVWGGVFIDGKIIAVENNGNAADSKTMIGVSSGSVVSSPVLRVGFLINKTVDWITINHCPSAYTVPAGKQLVIINQTSYSLTGSTCMRTLNTIPLDNTAGNLTNAVLDEGTVLSSVGCQADGFFNINGYLKDK